MLVGSAVYLSDGLASRRYLELHLAQVAHQALLSWRCHVLHSLGSHCFLVPFIALLLFHQKMLISFLAWRHLLKSILMILSQSHILTVLFAHQLCCRDRLILFSKNVILAPHMVQSSDISWRVYLPPFVSRLGSLCWLTAQTVESGLNVEVLHLHLF